MLRVRDIMTRHVVSLAVEASLDSAAWKLANEAVTGAPVRDQHGNVVGVLSRSDLADALRLGETDRSVGEAMTAGVWAVHPDAPAIEAVQLMVDCGIHRAVVLRGPGRLEGIVTRISESAGAYRDKKGLVLLIFAMSFMVHFTTA
ncbi:MAG: CBS domain-containing protein, partial [Myxococcota bacterium]